MNGYLLSTVGLAFVIFATVLHPITPQSILIILLCALIMYVNLIKFINVYRDEVSKEPKDEV